MAYFDLVVVPGKGTVGTSLIVTCSSSCAGQTITCTDGTRTMTQTCPSSSPYQVTFEDVGAGTWTVSVTISGQTTSKQIVISDFTAVLNAIPDGSTVTPVNDIQIWLHCANIWDKNYTTLDEVLADNTTLLALISSNNAVDYMVRSTDWAVYDELIPAMTSATTPSGEVSSSGHLSGQEAYKAFDRVKTTGWASSNQTPPHWIAYKFTTPTVVKSAFIACNVWTTTDSSKYDIVKIQASNDNANWIDLTSEITIYWLSTAIAELNNSNAYLYYRLYYVQSTYGYSICNEFQLYSNKVLTNNQTAMGYIGNNDYCADTLLADDTWCEAICNSTYFESVLTTKVPTMTSANTPSGKVSSNSEYVNAAQGVYHYAWQAFDASESTYWQNNGNTPVYDASRYVQYQFTSAVNIKRIDYTDQSGGATYFTMKTFDVQASNDGTNFTTIKSGCSVSSTEGATSINILNGNNTKYKYWRITNYDSQYTSNNYLISCKQIQFYGRA